MAHWSAMSETARGLGGVCLTLALLGSAPASAASLVLYGGDSARPALRLELAPGQAFQLEHNNSIYDAPVRETYVLGPRGRLIQVELASPSAGVFEYYGFDPPPQGKVALHQEVGGIRLLSMNYQHHLLRLGGRTIRLEGLTQPGSILRLEVDGPKPLAGVINSEAKP